MDRFSPEQEKKLMKEKGLRNRQELEEWYRGRDESIRMIRERIRSFFYSNKAREGGTS